MCNRRILRAHWKCQSQADWVRTAPISDATLYDLAYRNWNDTSYFRGVISDWIGNTLHAISEQLPIQPSFGPRPSTPIGVLHVCRGDRRRQADWQRRACPSYDTSALGTNKT